MTVGEIQERDCQEDLPEEELRSLHTGGKNAFIQGLHGDYIVIF